MLPHVLAKFRENLQNTTSATGQDLAQTSAILKQPLPLGTATSPQAHRFSQLHPILQSILYPRERRPDVTCISFKARES